MTTDWICPRCDGVDTVAGPCGTCTVGRVAVHRVPSALYGSPDPSAPADPLVGQVLGEDLLVRCIGRGGFGAVYLGLRGELGIKVAVKVLLPDVSDVMLDSLRIEGAALARLHHPNIVRVLGFGEHAGRAYLTMEFVEGGQELSEAIEALDVDARHRVLRELVHALDAAHNQGLVHRDVKPANVMLQAVEGNPHFVRLLDFGIAKDVTYSDRTGVIRGTPGYLAPEQALGRGIGPQADLFAVALMACQFFWGRPFFSGSALDLVKARASPGFDLTHHFESCGPATQAFARTALAWDPRDRFPDAAAFLDGLAAMAEEVAGRAGVTATLGPTLVTEAPEPTTDEGGSRWVWPLASALMLAVVLVAWLRTEPVAGAAAVGADLPLATAVKDAGAALVAIQLDAAPVPPRPADATPDMVAPDAAMADPPERPKPRAERPKVKVKPKPVTTPPGISGGIKGRWREE